MMPASSVTMEPRRILGISHYPKEGNVSFIYFHSIHQPVVPATERNHRTLVKGRARQGPAAGAKGMYKGIIPELFRGVGGSLVPRG